MDGNGADALLLFSAASATVPHLLLVLRCQSRRRLLRPFAPMSMLLLGLVDQEVLYAYPSRRKPAREVLLLCCCCCPVVAPVQKQNRGEETHFLTIIQNGSSRRTKTTPLEPRGWSMKVLTAALLLVAACRLPTRRHPPPPPSHAKSTAGKGLGSRIRDETTIQPGTGEEGLPMAHHSDRGLYMPPPPSSSSAASGRRRRRSARWLLLRAYGGVVASCGTCCGTVAIPVSRGLLTLTLVAAAALALGVVSLLRLLLLPSLALPLLGRLVGVVVVVVVVVLVVTAARLPRRVGPHLGVGHHLFC